VLRSTDPSDTNVVAQTVIDGGEAGPVVTFGGTEDETCVLAGFTVRNGYGSQGVVLPAMAPTPQSSTTLLSTTGPTRMEAASTTATARSGTTRSLTIGARRTAPAVSVRVRRLD